MQKNETENILSAWDIDVVFQNYTVWHILNKIEKGEINLYPEFQRSVKWDNSKKSRLIESMLIRFPIPVFYFNENNNHTYDVIDGLHRLLSFISFFNGNFSLTNLEYFSELNGSNINDLPHKYTRRLEETTINVYIIKKGTPQNIIRNLFVRLNTTATIFNNNEIRHILYYNNSLKFISDITNSEIFLLTIEFSDKRLIYEELVLRFIGFYYYRNDYKGNLGDFLDFVIVKAKEFDIHKKSEIKQNLLRSLEILSEMFGSKIFKKPNSRIQIKSLFEVWTVSISKLDLDKQNKLLLKQAVIIEKYNTLLDYEKDFINSISQQTTKRKATELRFKTIENLLNNIL